jgi:CBS domain containing-hemolysin-like protein
MIIIFRSAVLCGLMMPNRQMEMGIPESEEYHTVAGFILKNMEKYPRRKTFR